ncbi:hypothetical protein CHLNCDRAFT_24090 [Chlorella variabilis]|uniref:mRNA guanylyltransferase n=1 Tax=Chlorella variabilis TaxID=554065 RepID=E1ZGV4_CHLVA|nr:hypothetical protein CHLNCDRAFT_24090 [Chlorella variabilis]EFN54818.1 hypothetical protein CHLNCDRAFT_24090 [Chlorella variabilis]|eukprot:XP_005846920.1 hypothetical protein CHLNCDRAFT_24090 [Chlorella variabilis]
MGIPRGWRECPAMGRPIERFIPMKVPLGARFDSHIAPEHRFTIDDAVAQARKVPAVLGLVIDLTNSSRYYDARQWHERGVQYIKASGGIPCRGRGAAPPPEAVTDLCWEMYAYLQQCPQGMALIHCTHGFNRTGYMVASYLARMMSWTVPKALDAFAHKRPPGIYKHYYIRELFKYYHERLPSNFPFPPQPSWKAGDSPEQEDEGEGSAEGLGLEEDLHHDDMIGEGVSRAEGAGRAELSRSLARPERSGAEHKVWLPGSQPVSLDKSNLSLLKERQYWVTWKADGTRYMLVLLRWGTYLVDRKFSITRVQMRWPTPLQPGQPAKGPVGPMHHWTVLDGEMVVDEVLEEGRQERRFLAYDMVMLNGRSLVDHPWMERFKLIQRFVVEPRQLERHKITSKQWQYPYQYEKEAFHVRRKDFWPLTKAHKLIHEFIPNLCHEADGLIFQGAQDRYVPGTCPELLKWKFAHMNSVDFRLRLHPRDGQLLELLETRRELPEGHHRGYNALPGARVEFPEGEDAAMYDMRIIECSYDADAKVWRFMRERKDKDAANAFHVYESVARSIEASEQEELLQYIQEALQLPLYDLDCGRMSRQQQQQQP